MTCDEAEREARESRTCYFVGATEFENSLRLNCVLGKVNIKIRFT
jgi:hypothetical protein